MEFSAGKLILFPEQIVGLLRGDPYVPPATVSIVPSMPCNLRCVWCVDMEFRKSSAVDFMEPDMFRRTVHDVGEFGVRGIVIEGGGEPTVHPQFNQLLSSAVDGKAAVGLITNGIRFKSFDLVRKMSWVRFSLDATTEAEFVESKRVKASLFQLTLDHIRLSAAKKGDCRVGVAFLATNKTGSHLYDIVKMLRGFGVDYVQIRPVTEMDGEFDAVDFDLQGVQSLQTEDFGVFAHQMNRTDVVEDAPGNEGLPCLAHTLISVIGPDGSVYLCWRLTKNGQDGPDGFIGNLHDDSFRSIWAGYKRAEYVRQAADGDWCKKNCPVCRMTKYNVILDAARRATTPEFV